MFQKECITKIVILVQHFEELKGKIHCSHKSIKHSLDIEKAVRLVQLYAQNNDVWV